MYTMFKVASSDTRRQDLLKCIQCLKLQAMTRKDTGPTQMYTMLKVLSNNTRRHHLQNGMQCLKLQATTQEYSTYINVYSV